MPTHTVPPFPLELITDHPKTATMTALELGALISIALSFWRAGAEMPVNDDVTLSVLARCHTRRWYDVRDRVLPVWRALQPDIISVYARQAGILDDRRRTAIMGRAALAAKRAKANIHPNDARLRQAGQVPRGALPVTKTETLPKLAISAGFSTELVPKRTLRGQNSAVLRDTP